MTFRYVKSVCQSWFGAVVGLAKRSAAFIRMKAGLVIRPWSFKSRETVASDTKLPFVSVKLTASSRGDRSGSSRARLTIAVSILSGIWNKIPDKIETAIVNLALEEPDLSPRELAVNFTDTKGSFVSEATVYRLLKDHGLITSPAFILMKAADRFANPTTAPNQLWQTDFTYLKVIGWGWFYLSTVLDDFSRYILAWKLCTTMSATDVSDTLQV